MSDKQLMRDLFQRLDRLCKEIAFRKYDKAAVEQLFELTKTAEYPGLVADLAESFGIMMVKVEAREFRLEQIIDDLEKTKAHLEQYSQSLEQMVTERTAQLQEKNTLLEQEVEERRKMHAERGHLIEELRRALSKVKTLSGFLPICAACKKIRDDEGYWNQIESYIREHADVEFTHSICPDCAQKLYPQFSKARRV